MSEIMDKIEMESRNRNDSDILRLVSAMCKRMGIIMAAVGLLS